MIPLFMSAPSDEDWWHSRPDEARYAQLRDELAERQLTGGPVNDPTPRRRKSDDDMNPWVKLALQVGVPAVIALFLVQQLATTFHTKLDASVDLIRGHSQMAAASYASIGERLERNDRTQSVMIDLLRAQCVNQAKSFEERNRCLVAGASR
jgi:hypothetical protein